MTATLLSDFDSLVTQLVAQGVPRAKAEEVVRRELRLPDPASAIDDDSLEDEHIDAGDKLCRALGAVVVKFSQKRRSKVTEGIPDRRYYFPRRRLVFWWEAKASWGRHSSAQKDFQWLCDQVGDTYVLGGLEQLRAHLTAAGVATFDDESGLPTPIPFTEENHHGSR